MDPNHILISGGSVLGMVCVLELPSEVWEGLAFSEGSGSQKVKWNPHHWLGQIRVRSPMGRSHTCIPHVPHPPLPAVPSSKKRRKYTVSYSMYNRDKSSTGPQNQVPTKHPCQEQLTNRSPVGRWWAWFERLICSDTWFSQEGLLTFWPPNIEDQAYFPQGTVSEPIILPVDMQRFQSSATSIICAGILCCLHMILSISLYQCQQDNFGQLEGQCSFWLSALVRGGLDLNSCI